MAGSEFVETEDVFGSSGRASGDLSPTMRDYLAEIYRLSGQNDASRSGYVSTSALAEVLEVSAPAVNRMIPARTWRRCSASLRPTPRSTARFFPRS